MTDTTAATIGQDLDDASFGLDPGDLEDDTSTSHTEPGEPERPVTRSRRVGARGPRRGGKLRRPIERALALARLDATTTDLLCAAFDIASTIEGDERLVELAIASLEDAALARSTLSTLGEMIAVDDLEAGVLATGMVAERPAFRRLWTVLRTLDPSVPASIPARAVQAGSTVARSARGLPKGQRMVLEQAREVLA